MKPYEKITADFKAFFVRKRKWGIWLLKRFFCYAKRAILYS